MLDEVQEEQPLQKKTPSTPEFRKSPRQESRDNSARKKKKKKTIEKDTPPTKLRNDFVDTRGTGLQDEKSLRRSAANMNTHRNKIGKASLLPPPVVSSSSDEKTLTPPDYIDPRLFGHRRVHASRHHRHGAASPQLDTIAEAEVDPGTLKKGHTMNLHDVVDNLIHLDTTTNHRNPPHHDYEDDGVFTSDDAAVIIDDVIDLSLDSPSDDSPPSATRKYGKPKHDHHAIRTPREHSPPAKRSPSSEESVQKKPRVKPEGSAKKRIRVNRSKSDAPRSSSASRKRETPSRTHAANKQRSMRSTNPPSTTTSVSRRSTPQKSLSEILQSRNVSAPTSSLSSLQVQPSRWGKKVWVKKNIKPSKKKRRHE